MVEVEGLSHFYGARCALKEVSFTAAAGEMFAVLGPNGSGKSTLFQILATLIRPSGGSVRIDGIEVGADSAEVRKRLGVVFQAGCLDRMLTPSENLEALALLYGLRGQQARRALEEVLGRLGVADRKDHLVRDLSGGLRRRVEIAGALLHRPKLLLLDEPTAGLDPGARRELWAYLEQLCQQQQMTILLTTHLMDEAGRCDQVLMLHQGRAVAQGSPPELTARIPGEVVLLSVADPVSAASKIRRLFGVEPGLVDGRLRMETPDGLAWIAAVREALPGEITSIELHKPTLEDVFLNETGSAFDAH